MGQGSTPITRSQHACDRCRARKRRCEFSICGGNEQCDECYSFDKQCTFLHPGLGRGIRKKRRFRRPGVQVAAGPRASQDLSPTATLLCPKEHEFGQRDAPEALDRASGDFSLLGTHSNPHHNVAIGSTSPSDDVASIGTEMIDPVLGLVSPGPPSTSHPDFSTTPPSTLDASSPWPDDILHEYRATMEHILPLMDTTAPLSELGTCTLLAALQAPLSDSEAPRDPYTVMRRVAVRYMRDVQVSVLTENEIRAALLLYMKSPARDDQSPDLQAFFERVVDHLDGLSASPSDTDSTTCSTRSVAPGGVFPLSACVALVGSWKRLETHKIPGSVSFMRLDPTTHSNPFTEAFLHLSRVLHRKIREDDKPISAVEIDLLLWPATLSTDLSFVNHHLASAGSSLLHVLHNAVAMWYYASRIDRKDALLEPNEAVLSFLATLGCSCIKVWRQRGREMVDAWGNMFIIGLATAVDMLCVYVQRYGCGKCRGVLVNFLLSLNVLDVALFPRELIDKAFQTLMIPSNMGLQEQQSLLRQETCGPYFEISDTEGTIIYWMFRDLRNMTLRHSVEGLEYRRQSQSRSGAFTKDA